jgi:hypothetical protein
VNVDLDDDFRAFKYVFTKAQGLVRGTVRGEIVITKFNSWVPIKPPIVAARKLEGRITALNTNNRIIVAGSEGGNIGVWNYEGRLIHKVSPDNKWVRSISILENRIMIIGWEHLVQYKLIQNSLFLISKEEVDLDWALYNFDNEIVINEYDPDWTVTEFKPFRPILPKSVSDRVRLFYSRMEFSSRKSPIQYQIPVKQEVHIAEFPNYETIIRQFSLYNASRISNIWCTQEKLFVLTETEIMMMDFTQDVPDFQQNNSYEITDYFALQC